MSWRMLDDVGNHNFTIFVLSLFVNLIVNNLNEQSCNNVHIELKANP